MVSARFRFSDQLADGDREAELGEGDGQKKSRGRHHVKPDAFTTDEPCDDNPVDKAEHSRNQTRRY